MNKAITDGIVFQSLPFAAGPAVWSSGDGTPGRDTYATSGNASYVGAVAVDSAFHTAANQPVNQQPWADNNYGTDQRIIRFVFD